MREQNRRNILSRKWRTASQKLIQYDPRRVLIDPTIDLGMGFGKQLWCQVQGRSHDRAGGRKLPLFLPDFFCDPKVQHLELNRSIRNVVHQPDVGRLTVPW